MLEVETLDCSQTDSSNGQSLLGAYPKLKSLSSSIIKSLLNAYVRILEDA